MHGAPHPLLGAPAGLLADECNTWCSRLQKMHTSVVGKAVLRTRRGPS